MTVTIIRRSAPQPKTPDQAAQADIARQSKPLPADKAEPRDAVNSNVSRVHLENQQHIAPTPLRSEETWDGPKTRLRSRVPATLADVLTAVGASSLSPAVKRDVSWAIRVFARGTGRTPSDIAADPRAIREHLRTMSPAMLGLETDSSFYNMKSLLRKGLDLVGKAVRPRARNVPLNPE